MDVPVNDDRLCGIAASNSLLSSRCGSEIAVSYSANKTSAVDSVPKIRRKLPDPATFETAQYEP